MDNVISLDERRPADSNPEGYPVLRPRAVLPDPGDIIGLRAAIDTETTDLHVDDGATLAVTSVAYRLKSAPAVIESYAFPFDQGRAEEKGFEIQRYKDGRPKADVDLAKWQVDVNLPESDWNDLLDWIGQVPYHIGQNYKFDLHHQRNGTRHFKGRDFGDHFMWDTQLTNRHLWPTESTSLKPTGERLFGPEAVAEAQVLKQGLIDCKKLYGLRAEHGPRYDLLPWDINGPYAAKDTVLTLMLAEYQWVALFEEGQGLVGEVDQQFDLSRVLYRMERRGVGPFDKDRADRIARYLEWRIEELEGTFPFQPPTAHQARKFYFVGMGLAPWKGGEKPHVVNASGKIEQHGTLNTAVAKRLATADVPHAADYAEYLRLTTANRMHYRGYHDLCGEDGQMRTSFRQGFVKSGRMSVERWQAQALPKHLGLHVAGRDIPEPRSLFGVRPGHVRINLDLSQAEMRIAAKFSGCQTMIDLLESGGDMHGNTTRAVFNRDTDDPEWSFYRDIGKRLNFASIFLVGPKTFQDTLWTEAEVDWPLGQCKGAVYGWRRTYPEFEKEYQYWLQFAEVNGYVPLVKGRKSWLTARDWPRTGWNRRVQSSLAVFVADWLIEIERMTEKYDALELMVHDSAVLQLPEDVAEKVVEEIKSMTSTMWWDMFQISGGCDVSPFAK